MPSSVPRLFRRSSDELEFDRVAFFSDAIYAIAVTLIVVGIGAPVLHDTTSSKDFLDALWNKNPEIISFFLSFAVLGAFWTAHHDFFGRLAAIDVGLRRWNLVYLAFVAFLPYPTLLLGQYVDNAAAVSLYAISIGAISTMESVIYWHAHRAGLNRVPMPHDVARFGLVASMIPVAWFLVSIPVAFINPIAGMVTWAGSIPSQMLHARWAPDGIAEHFS
jgi:uncharacterized membrane protein